jgi:hypothetical protein
MATSETRRPIPENKAIGIHWLKSDRLVEEGEEVVETENGAEMRTDVGI